MAISYKLRQDGNYEQQHLSAELTALRAQKQEAQSELAAATHHRTVLRETIDQLDRRLAAHVETISDLKLQLQMGTRETYLKTEMHQTILQLILYGNSYGPARGIMGGRQRWK